MNFKNLKPLKLILGPFLFVWILSMPIEGLSDQGRAVLACTSWIALWWITEAVPLELTSLLPIIIFPLSGALSVSETTTSYGNPFIYLFLGGFIIGLAIERWGIHKRIAFSILHFVGTNEKMLLLGLMMATAFLSMWISNTATAIMMLPIGMSVISHFKGEQPFSRSVMLGIAYASSIGGMATLIGTPPNIILAGVAKDSLGIEISFLKWMLFGVPLAVVLLSICWLWLTRNFKNSQEKSQFETETLGEFSVAGKRTVMVVGLSAFLWITRSFIWNRWIPGMDDTVIAILGAVLMLIIPSGKKDETLITWKTAEKIPWSVLILFGAGLAIAKGFSTTDLTEWMGVHFARLSFMPAALIVLLILASINFLTEITSNTATASILLPILITLGVSLHLESMPLLAGAAISASCAFMLPVATPPNAIVFSSGQVTIKEMMRIGVLMNISSILVTYLFVEFVWHWIFG